MEVSVSLWWLMCLVLLIYLLSLCLAFSLCSHSDLSLCFVFFSSLVLAYVFSLMSSCVALACRYVGDNGGVVGVISGGSCSGTTGTTLMVDMSCTFDVSPPILAHCLSLLSFLSPQRAC